MSRAFTTEVTIARPVEDVWAQMTRWSDAPRWMKGIQSMRAEGDTQLGTRLVFDARGKERLSEITRCEAPRLLTLTATEGGVKADYTYTLRADGDSRTKIRLEADCELSGLGWRLVGPLLRVAMRAADGKQLHALRDWIEGD